MVQVNKVGKKKRKSGVPTGHAGEYSVMGELLKRGFDAQLADRNTQGYDILVGNYAAKYHQKVQVKTVRKDPWYVNQNHFKGDFLERITIYVLLGKEGSEDPVKYFIAKNTDVANDTHIPASYKENGHMLLKSVKKFENNWEILKDNP